MKHTNRHGLGHADEPALAAAQRQVPRRADHRQAYLPTPGGHRPFSASAL
jgi:hypothetical protein